MSVDSTKRSRSNGPSEDDLRNATPRDAVNRSARVGVFVLVGLASFITALFLLTSPATFRGRYFLTTTVPDAGGLRKGDPVQMRGVNVGRTHRFQLQSEGVLVTLEIEGEWGVPTDSRSQLIELGVLGGKIVDIVPGTSTEMMASGANIPGTAGSDLLGTVDMLSQRADGIMGQVETLLSPQTIEAVQGSAQELETLLQEVSDLTRSQGQEVARLTASLNRSAEGLEDASGAGADIARAAARADSTLAQLNRTSVRLDEVASSLAVVLARIENGEGTLGQLSTNDSLYHGLTSAIESVNLLVTDLREHPERYVKISVF